LTRSKTPASEIKKTSWFKMLNRGVKRLQVTIASELGNKTLIYSTRRRSRRDTRATWTTWANLSSTMDPIQGSTKICLQAKPSLDQTPKP
jgi:hypothetical protein